MKRSEKNQTNFNLANGRKFRQAGKQVLER